MKKKSSILHIQSWIFLTLSVATLSAATISLDNFDLNKIKENGGVKKLSKEVVEAFELSEKGLNEQAFKKFTLAAKRGEVTAYIALGVMYREGRGTPKNLKMAKDSFQKAAAKGSKQGADELALLRFSAPANLEEFTSARKEIEKLASDGLALAQLRLGLAHLTGYGYKADAKKAIDYLKQATKSTGSFKADAAFALGQIYRDGSVKPEIKSDIQLAESWLKQAAQAMHPGAMRALGEFYLSADPAQQNFKSARELFTKLDQIGDPYGLYFLGQMDENGWGGKKSLESAVAYYRKAADKKVPSALYQLGTFHEYGIAGLEKDKTKAIEYYRQGAELGHSICMYNLAVLLDTMKDQPKLKAEVMPWLLRAAAAGLVEAEYQIGVRYQQGLGVQQDYVAAAAWFNRGALSGHAQSQLYLGEMYEQSQGLRRDNVAARKLYELSANGGNLGGIIKYAEFLAKGVGGDQDLVKAYVFAESSVKAAQANTNITNSPLAKLTVELRDSILKIMSAEQLAEGEKRLKEIKK